MTRSVYIHTFGCQMNVLESEQILAALVSSGYRAADDPGQADVILYNTCSVRGHAEQRVHSHLGHLRKLRQRRPHLIVGVLGCMAQREGDSLQTRHPHVDLVLGTRRYGLLPGLLDQVADHRHAVTDTAEEDAPLHSLHRPAGVRGSKYTAYVQAMRGCNLRCTFCVVPSAKGPEVSRPAGDVVEECRRLAADGCREVTLLGQNIDGYRSPEGADLADLLRAVHDVPDLLRVRFVTSHPAHVSDKLLETMGRLERVCPYLHAPAQSGSDTVLRRMKRGYTAAQYVALAERARGAVPGLTLSSDFIVGFPGETEDDFQATLDLVRKVRFRQSFLFKYSPRPGTPAENLGDDVPDAVKKERHRRLAELLQDIGIQENRARIGSRMEVLVEGPSRTQPERLAGRTADYRIVILDEAGPELIGHVVLAEVTAATALALYAQPVPATAGAG